ncbi:MAG: hypothetical protein ABSG82_08070 [Sedimentisphaerales bacterium]|jgi:hypothetical protein
MLQYKGLRVEKKFQKEAKNACKKAAMGCIIDSGKLRVLFFQYGFGFRAAAESNKCAIF